MCATQPEPSGAAAALLPSVIASLSPSARIHPTISLRLRGCSASARRLSPIYVASARRLRRAGIARSSDFPARPAEIFQLEEIREIRRDVRRAVGSIFLHLCEAGTGHISAANARRTGRRQASHAHFGIVE